MQSVNPKPCPGCHTLCVCISSLGQLTGDPVIPTLDYPTASPFSACLTLRLHSEQQALWLLGLEAAS